MARQDSHFELPFWVADRLVKVGEGVLELGSVHSVCEYVPLVYYVDVVVQMPHIQIVVVRKGVRKGPIHELIAHQGVEDGTDVLENERVFFPKQFAHVAEEWAIPRVHLLNRSMVIVSVLGLLLRAAHKDAAPILLLHVYDLTSTRQSVLSLIYIVSLPCVRRQQAALLHCCW